MKPKQSFSTLIIGAGLAGLSTAYHLKKEYLLVEASDQVGGICRTDRQSGFEFDVAGHLLHLKTKGIKNLVNRLCPGLWQQHERDAGIMLKEKIFPYPFQSNLYHLATDVKAQALLDYLKALTNPGKKKINQFEQWSESSFGHTITELFLKPYNEKLWTVPAATLTLDWMSNYFPKPDVQRVLQGAFNDIKAAGGYNACFYYPKQAGIGQLADALGKKVVDRLQLNSKVTSVHIKKRVVTINHKQQHAWDRLVTTIPLPELIASIEDAPESIKQAAAKLKWNSVLVVNLGFKGKHAHQAHWLYFPEKEFCFYRVGFPSNFGKVGPENHSSLYAEIALKAGTGWNDRKKLAGQVKQDLIKAGILKPTDKIIAEHVQYISHAYVIFDKHYQASRKKIVDYLQQHQIYSIGRWGNWEYSAMEDALMAGVNTAKKIQESGK